MDGFLVFVFITWALIAFIVNYRRWRRAQIRAAAERAAQERARAAQAEEARRAERRALAERYNQLQRAVMACAKKEKGIVTPADVVASARVGDRLTLAAAKRQLDLMVQNGYLEPHATESGVPPIVYVVPEFLTDASRREIVGY